MSEQQKIYAPVRAKVVEFQSGKKILKISFKSDEMVEFIQKHTNQRGFVNLGVSKRKEVGRYGETHTVWLDTWEPGQQQPSAPRPAPAPTTRNINPPSDPEAKDVPF